MEPQDLLCQSIGAQQAHHPLQGGGEEDDHDDPHRRKHAVRKRTKTGCLTCRKRRIKCDEAKPTCGNCIKSKRQCDYNQRVIFKEPMGTYGAFGMPGGYPSDSSHAFVSHLAPTVSKSSPSSYNPHQLIAPKPPALDLHGEHHHPGHAYSGYGGEPASAISGAFDFSGPFGHHVMPPTPSVVSSTSTQPPLEIDGLPGIKWETYSSHGHDQPAHGHGYSSTSGVQPPRSLEAREPQSTAPHHRDIEFDSGSDDDLASESDGEGEVNLVARRREVGKVGAFGELLDGTVMAHHEIHETRMRTFSAYAEGTALTNYTPSASHSALNDPQTLAIFRHFIFVTGPSMSLYERHPFDNSYISPDEPLPQTGQTIWTYTFPILSLGHPGLLQAILAIGALQIANLQRIPATAAMKHYHLAIRRISKCVRSPTKRAHPATLAATLLLGFFEVWSADHTKWCRHLYGARILFKDIPFKEMTRTILPAKHARRRKVERQQGKQPFSPLFSYTDMDPDLDEVDVDLLSTISGRPLNPEDYGSNFDADSLPSHRLPTDRDIEHYEHLRDLFWWNCKMDVYQSILGATKIFMPIEEWLPCPPRAPIGRLHAIYGTFDHLLLLLARLSDFGSRDIPRKKKVNSMPGPPGSSSPMFVGMLPTRGKVTAPMGFSPPRDTSPQSESLEDSDLELATLAAHEEWEAIRHAFEVFRSRLGPDFQPLAEEFSDRRDTPFGTAIQYRTFSLAGIWMNYYMGLICLYRTHPSMPPAAMMAAGRAARETAPFAREIGRIAAGLTDDVSDVTEISTLVGAALIECCFCLFVAGIQFQDSAQRHWLVRRLHDVSRLTGWGSARQIAVGCEASWVRAAHMGRGPPYARSTDPVSAMQSSDPMAARPATVWSNPRRLDQRMREMGDGGGEGRLIVLQKADRAHFALGLLSVETDMDRLKLEDD